MVRPASAQNSHGIQTLLDAEREAQKIVQAAREYRTKRVKDARSEAQKEIEAYRQQKEEEFKKFEAEHSSGFKAAEEEANKDAEVKLREIKEAGAKNGPRVIENLVQTTINVEAKVPEKLARA
ncbi:Vacuolar (H+)-ATPase G subunit [Ascosphaera apis ARSEF 7405]|uniref:V-type proton ATPase subunit G n=1 Tax=Ascosphaera apis ARSEF 7405 TaxID=392613 RepID=A0A168DU61_9EURO|nr:Vacuolar (H+)-ATPase G subunit [Ascosphaera apis ARSEF 7405]